MATVTIILKDTEGGTVNAKVEFDPPITDETSGTTAQNAAGLMLEALSRAMNISE